MAQAACGGRGASSSSERMSATSSMIASSPAESNAAVDFSDPGVDWESRPALHFSDRLGDQRPPVIAREGDASVADIGAAARRLAAVNEHLHGGEVIIDDRLNDPFPLDLASDGFVVVAVAAAQPGPHVFQGVLGLFGQFRLAQLLLDGGEGGGDALELTESLPERRRVGAVEIGIFEYGLEVPDCVL